MRKKRSPLREWMNNTLPKREKKPSRKENGRITPETREAVLARDRHRCVRCGAVAGSASEYKGVVYFVRLEIHHIDYRSQLGDGSPRNLATVCGPVTQSGTCHHYAQNTREGREWFEAWRDEHLDERGNRK